MHHLIVAILTVLLLVPVPVWAQPKPKLAATPGQLTPQWLDSARVANLTGFTV